MGSAGEEIVSEPFRRVLQGQFPEDEINRMNKRYLEKFVLKLIKHSIKDGAKTNSFISMYHGINSKQISKPAWWPSDKILGPDYVKNGNILLKSRLKVLVEKCAEFFRNSCDNFVKELYIDKDISVLNQHVEVVRRSVRVRSFSKSDENFLTPSKRKALCFKNSTPPSPQTSCKKTNVTARPSAIIDLSNDEDTVRVHFTRQTVIPLIDVFQSETVKDPQNQTSFLGDLFGLSNAVEKENSKNKKRKIATNNGSVIKITNSHNIPFSSDIGRMLIKRDSHCFPESLQSRKYEKLEWYINKPVQRPVEVKYEVAYHESKKDNRYSDSCHIYKFPKRQFCQYQYPTKFQLEVCKPLKIVLRRNSLDELKKNWKTSKMHQIVLPQIFRMKSQKQNLILKIKLENMDDIKKENNVKKLVPNPFNKIVKQEMLQEKINNLLLEAQIKQPVKFNKKRVKNVDKAPVVKASTPGLRQSNIAKLKADTKKLLQLISPVKKAVKKTANKKVIVKAKVKIALKSKKVFVQNKIKNQKLTAKKVLTGSNKVKTPIKLSKVSNKKMITKKNSSIKIATKVKPKVTLKAKKVKAPKVSATKFKTQKQKGTKASVKTKNKKTKSTKKLSLNPKKTKAQKSKLSEQKSKTIKKSSVKSIKKDNNSKPPKKVQTKLQMNSKSQLKSKKANLKIQKITQKQQKLKHEKSKTKVAKSKVNSPLKKKLLAKVQKKKIKVQCPTQGKQQMKNKTVLLKKELNKHKGKRKN